MKYLEKLIYDEIENDFDNSGYDLEEYIEMNDMILLENEFEDYNLYNLIYDCLEIKNDKLVRKVWIIWKSSK